MSGKRINSCLYLPVPILIALCANTGIAQQSVDEHTEIDSTLTDTASADDAPRFNGEGGLGLIINSGNTESENLYANLKLRYTMDSWQHEFNVDARQTTAEQIETAKRLLLAEKTSYTFSEHIYVFSALRYDKDRFSGFDYQASGSIGAGWHMLNDEINRLDMDIGVGGNANKLQDSDDLERDTIARFGFQLASKLTPNTQFNQDLLVEVSELNTQSESKTGLKIAMNAKFALQLLYLVKKNSQPPAATLSVDRNTTINLIYAF